MNAKRVLTLLTATVWLAFYLPLSHAQTPKWPEKPVRVIVPFPPGGTTDVVARIFAPQMAEEFGQQFVVDNRPGAGGAIGAEIAARAYPDGHTIIVVTSSYAANGALYKLPYDPVKGIAPVSLISILPFILAAHPSVKATNLKDFIELARGNPGTLNFASPGTGSGPHLTAELFQQMAKIKMVHVAYKGDAPALADLLGGQIQVTFATDLILGTHIKAGKLRALAYTDSKRHPQMPDVPTAAEAGLPNYTHSGGWFGMFAPAGTPPEILNRLHAEVKTAFANAQFRERLSALGADPVGDTPAEFKATVSADIKRFAEIARLAKIQPE